MTFLTELKRRNVFKVAIAYLVMAWVLIQVADILAPQLNLPDWAPRLITFILLLGFPVSLLLAWAFDLTPAGIHVEKSAAGGKGLYIAVAVMIIAVIAWYAGDDDTMDAPEGGSRSIAVLPFVNMSGDEDNQYFSDGISEELLNEFAKMPALKVASRTSSFAFRDGQMEIQDIAAELGVALVLEGSVRRQADQVRITAQLIDAQSGFHIWSETYDRGLRDIFATQDEIALAVAEALELQLGVQQRPGQDHFEIDPATYDKYLRARQLFPSRRPADLEAAAVMLEEVIAAEPDFAEAYANLALIYAVTPFYSTAPRVEMHARARDAALRALALSPGMAEAYGALGDVAIHDGQYDLAEVLLKRAISEAPSMPAGHYWLAENYLYTGNFNAALAELDIALELDPFSTVGRSLRALTLLAMDQPDEAHDSCAAVLEAAPEHQGCRATLVIISLGQGNKKQAADLLVDNPILHGHAPVALAHVVANALVGGGETQAIAAIVRDLPYHGLFDPAALGAFHDMLIPALLIALGEREYAIERFVVSVGREPKDMQDVTWAPALDPIRCDPRFQAQMETLGIIDVRHDTVCR